MAVQRSVSVKILRMKNSCLLYERAMVQEGNCFSFSYSFIGEVVCAL